MSNLVHKDLETETKHTFGVNLRVSVWGILTYRYPWGFKVKISSRQRMLLKLRQKFPATEVCSKQLTECKSTGTISYGRSFRVSQCSFCRATEKSPENTRLSAEWCRLFIKLCPDTERELSVWGPSKPSEAGTSKPMAATTKVNQSSTICLLQVTNSGSTRQLESWILKL